jgi:hypothetical protein
MDMDQQNFINVCLGLAIFRVYLELINFKFLGLPISRKLAEAKGDKFAVGVHRFGLYMSIGYIILFAPTLLLN